jgi:pimeloyl-ACP methyl ester carboxylesterase
VNIASAAQRGRLRIIIMAAVLAVAGLLIPASQLASAHTTARAGATHASGPKPTIVLEHGAWADGSSWNAVIRRLQHDGYKVYAPPNPLLGLAVDPAYLRGFLNTIKGPIVLVGHSYGGAVITNAATGDKQVKALVYVDAFAPAKNQTLGQLVSSKPGSCVVAADPTTIFKLVPIPGAPVGDVDAFLKQRVFPNCMANGLPAGEAAVLGATQRPLATIALSQKSGVPAWKTIPSWSVVGTADHAILPAIQLAMDRRAHAHITRVHAPHLSMISNPRVVTRVILKAVHATT